MPEPSTEQGLLGTLQSAFSRATSEYNQVHQLAEKLEASTQQVQSQGVVVQGFKQTVVNRYHGITNLKGLYTKAEDGAKWGYYFAMCPTLKNDVEGSGVAWARSQLSLPNISLQGVAKASATGLGTTRQDIERVEAASRQRVSQQAQTMGISLAVSSGISSLLKQVGQASKTQATRNLAMTARRSWQVSGVLAFAFGLGKISDSIHESGSFAEHLRLYRDKFNTSQTSAIGSVTEPVREVCDSPFL